MSIEQVGDALASLDVPKDVARTYVVLCLTSGATASEVATAIGTSRTDAYRKLRELVQRRFAKATLQRPVRFIPEPPERVFEILLENATVQRDLVERVTIEVSALLSTLRAEPSADLGRATFSVLEGRDQVERAIERLRIAAQKDIMSVLVDESSDRLAVSDDVWHVWQAKARHGVKLRILLSLDEARQEKARQLASLANVEIAGIELGGTLRFMIADRTEMVIFAQHTRGTTEDIAIATNAPDLVFAETILFEELWRGAVPVETISR